MKVQNHKNLLCLLQLTWCSDGGRGKTRASGSLILYNGSAGPIFLCLVSFELPLVGSLNGFGFGFSKFNGFFELVFKLIAASCWKHEPVLYFSSGISPWIYPFFF